MIKYAPTNIDALVSLVGGSITTKADGSIVFFDGQTPPTEEAIQAEISRLEKEYSDNEYARNRQAEYPSIADLVVALYDTDDKSAVEAKRAAVKAKYPKPE